MKKRMIQVLTNYAIENGWSATMYEIVENDIENDVFKNIKDLKKYISQS